MDKLIAEYIINFERICVYACFNSQEDMDNDEVEFFDLYHQRGPEQICINEGVPFFPDECQDSNCPTYTEVKEFVESL
jgi:hypothetical protein